MDTHCQWRSCLLLFQTVICLLLSMVHANDLIIQTTLGKIRGATKAAPTGKLVDMWQSIPFAQPPVGPLRFRHPRPMEGWDEVKDTDSPANSCWQALDTTYGDFKGSTMWNANTELSEDCLYLTVTVPRPRPRHAAVMVWFFGGGFTTGSTTLDVYDPKILASEENVIVVAIQYRLASLGFLFFDTSEASGNAGLYDQVMALQWIHSNIHAFGGNPHNVTLFGESAGAAAVAMHILSPISRDLFNQAILQSGTATAPWAIVSKEESIKRGLDLAKRVGCPNDLDAVAKIMECLRETNASTLINEEPFMDFILGFTFIPIVDGNILDQNPAQLLADNSNLKKINLLMGSNSEEGFFFISYFMNEIFPNNESVTITRGQFLEAVGRVNQNANKPARQAIIFEYTNWLNLDDPRSNMDAVDKMVGDNQFVCGVNEFAQRFAEAGNNVFMYYFTHRSSVSPWPKWMGVLHADEINFIFGEPLNPEKGYTQEETEFSRKVMRYWTNFAKTGNPNKNQDSLYTKDYWPQYDPTKREYVVLAPRNNTIGRGHRARQCAFWKKHLPQLQQIVECSSSNAIYNSAITTDFLALLLPSVSLLVTTKLSL